MGNTARWRVVIVDDHERSRSLLRAAIWQARGEIAGEAVRCADALVLVQRERPDVAVLAVGLPDGDGVDLAARLTGEAQCPVVLLTSHGGADVSARACAAGVMGFLVKPVRPAALGPALDVAVARFRDLVDVRQRLEARKVVERAKGMLMARHGLTEDEAFRRLRRTAMDSRRAMVDVARALLASEALLTPDEARS